jgi:hypothetical protein
VRADPGIQVFVYPEELDAVGPDALAEQILELGFDSVSIALAYHRARRVFPRQRRISVSPGGAISFTPNAVRYGHLVPEPTASADLRRAVLAFRESCREAGLRFRAWLVALHNEPLALAHPDIAARTLDGSSTEFSLCPSADETVEYVAALVGDVCSQFQPEGIDLEAALYPAWEPSYTLTLALEPLSERAVLFGAQCFCVSCRRLFGTSAPELEARAKHAAGPPFGALGADDATVGGELARVRAARVGRLVAAAARSAHTEGSSLCVTASGPATQAHLRGLAPSVAATADRVLLGHGTLAGLALEHRLSDLRALVGDRDVTVSLNWSSERSPEAFAADAELVAAGGATGLALYNLSLVPQAGLDGFRAAAAAFRAVTPAVIPDDSF